MWQYAAIAQPLTELMRREEFHCDELQKLAFENLKHALTTAPVLRQASSDEDFVLSADASGFLPSEQLWSKAAGQSHF